MDQFCDVVVDSYLNGEKSINFSDLNHETMRTITNGTFIIEDDDFQIPEVLPVLLGANCSS